MLVTVLFILILFLFFLYIVSLPVLYAGYGQGSGPIHLDGVSCSGNEERLVNCPYDPNSSEDSHAEDAGVICFDGVG